MTDDMTAACPFGVDTISPFDHLDAGTEITKTSARGYRATWPNPLPDTTSTREGYPIAVGSPLDQMPVGTQLLICPAGESKVMIILPETTGRGPLASCGTGLHAAIAALWPYLVSEGHAKVSA